MNTILGSLWHFPYYVYRSLVSAMDEMLPPDPGLKVNRELSRDFMCVFLSGRVL